MNVYEVWGAPPNGPQECYCATWSFDHANWLSQQLTAAQWIGVTVKTGQWPYCPPW